MKKKLLSILLVVGLVAALLVGCGSDDAEETEAPDTTEAAGEEEAGEEETGEEEAGEEEASGETYDIVVMPKLIGIPYFTQTGEGAIQAGEDLGVNVIYNGPTVGDVAEQIKMLEDYITQGVDAIAVAPNDPAAMDPVLKKEIGRASCRERV